MSYLEIIINNCIYLLCPLALYLIYTTYQKNVDQEKNSMMFEIATISSLYFILRYGMSFHGRLGAMLFDIPLLLCFFKQRKGFSMIISFLLIFYQTFFLSVNVFFLFIEYSSYFIVYLLLEKEKFTIFTLLHHFFVVHSFFLSMKIFLYLNPLRGYQENLFYLFFVLLIQILISSLVLSFFDKGEKIVDFNTTLYNIEKEKELRASLFKVTHEIKNPIAVCKGYLDMLDVNNQKKVHQYIPIVKDEINRTLTLMDDFLDYTKIKIVKEEIDLILLLEEIEETLSSLFKEKGVLCLIDKKDEEIYFEADYNRLKQVFINLLKNAIEAKDDEKKEQYVKISVKQEKDVIILTIVDNGIGMEEEECMRVGEMFFTTKEKGTGLGTALSKEIIELHQGTIFYQSKKMEGTKIKITLPKTSFM